jgi:hypothetical protein
MAAKSAAAQGQAENLARFLEDYINDVEAQVHRTLHIKRNELNRAHGFRRSDMQDIETSRPGGCRIEFAQPSRSSKCSRPLNSRTNQAATSQVTLRICARCRNIGCSQ